MYHSQHTDEVAAIRPGPREGSDAILVTWGNSVMINEDAARNLEDKGICAEVIDLRTILPWDQQLVLKSIQKTDRALVVHEANMTNSFCAETSARITGNAFESLSPSKARSGKDSFCPYAKPLENGVLPQKVQVITAADELVGY